MSQYSDDSHIRFWSKTTVSAGTPTLQASFNVTSITDTATGQLTVTIDVDFTSANWCCQATVELTSTSLVVANARIVNVKNAGQAAGTVVIECHDETVVTNLDADPAAWHISGMGIQ